MLKEPSLFVPLALLHHSTTRPAGQVWQFPCLFWRDPVLGFSLACRRMLLPKIVCGIRWLTKFGDEDWGGGWGGKRMKSPQQFQSQWGRKLAPNICLHKLNTINLCIVLDRKYASTQDYQKRPSQMIAVKLHIASRPTMASIFEITYHSYSIHAHMCIWERKRDGEKEEREREREREQQSWARSGKKS